MTDQRLRTLVRLLTLTLLVLALAATVGAGLCFVEYKQTDPVDDPWVGLWAVYGVALLVFASVTAALGLPAVLVRRAGLGYGLSLTTGIWALACAALPALFLMAGWWLPLGALITLTPLATIASSAVGLARRPSY